MAEAQLPNTILDIIKEESDLFDKGTEYTDINRIPDTKEIPIENPLHWLKIPNVICVYVDMKGSTQLSASGHPKDTAAAYRLFTGTAVSIFDDFESAYIDIKGDGVFALFNEDEPYRAVCAAVAFKSFANDTFVKKVKAKTGLDVGTHLGIDQKDVLVRKLGLKRHKDRTDRQNEVWAGKPVNMAAKLASLSDTNELLISERFYKNLKDKKIIESCGCPNGEVSNLWSEVDVSKNGIFDFKKAYKLRSNWCVKHGADYIKDLMKLDKQK